MIECPSCKSQNSDGKRFCGDCGAPLTAMAIVSEPGIRETIRAVLKDEFKDQKVVEVEIAESVANRISTWLKYTAFIVGIPLTIALLALAAFGINKVSDFATAIDKAESKINTTARNAENTIQRVAKNAESKEQQLRNLGSKISSLETQYAGLKTSLAEQQKKTNKLQNDVNQVRKAVEIIGRGFTPSEFKDYVATLQFASWKPKFIVLHSTQVPNLTQWHKGSAEKRLKALAIMFGSQFGWSRGPHLFIDDEKIWVFSPLTQPGTHTPSWNKVSIGIDMVGDYDRKPLDEHVRDNTVAAVAILDSFLKLKPESIKFHNEDPITTHRNCPGRYVDKADLIRRISAVLDQH